VWDRGGKGGVRETGLWGDPGEGGELWEELLVSGAGEGRLWGFLRGFPLLSVIFRDPMMLLPSDMRRARKPKLRRT